MGFEWDCSKCATSPDLKGTVVIQFWDSTQHRSQGYVGYRKDSHEIIVAFRGTTNLSEMLNNLKFSLVDWNGAGSGAKVHSGFSAAYTSAANIVRTSIDGLLKKDSQAKVVFVGHSLGGAQASLAAADFVFRYPTLKTKVSLYTFGQPRVGNPVFANWMDRQDFPVFRVVHRTDLVSQLPPQVPIKAVEYQHHSEEVFYPLSGQLTFCGKNNPESDNCQNSVSTKQLSTTDHINYPGMEH
ncbi:alpha/beta-hydrolase [Martensiomyces pterosporus]|nr:alpha/beta-hydrolase [Martensiomyces pterosporus]